MLRNNSDCWCEALKLVPRRWRAEFTRFLEEGEASDEFLAFLEMDQRCRQACEMVLRADGEMAALVAAVEDDGVAREQQVSQAGEYPAAEGVA